MYIKSNTLLLVAGFVFFAALRSQAQSAISGGRIDKITDNDTARSISPFFIPATKSKKSPDPEGFIQRWLLLEPINKSIRSNLVFTDSYLKMQFDTAYFPNQFAVIPGEYGGLDHQIPYFGDQLFRNNLTILNYWLSGSSSTMHYTII